MDVVCLEPAASKLQSPIAPPFAVQALGEPTSVLASLGTAVVFVSAVAAARIDARGRAAPLSLK